MSDLSNLFIDRNKKYTTPIKRLFRDSSSTTKTRNSNRHNQPSKSIHKNRLKKEKKRIEFDNKDLIKRYMTKQDLKKQVKFYNQQVILSLIKKIFFMMGGVLLFNIFFTSSRQLMILSNMFLSLTLTSINIGYNLLGNWVIIVCREVMKLTAYCLNFYLFYGELKSNKRPFDSFSQEAIIISLNAVLNYGIFMVCQPIIFLQRVQNHKKPYSSFIQKLLNEGLRFLKSFTTIVHLIRPIMLINLVYWLIVVVYISIQKSTVLCQKLVSLQTLCCLIQTLVFLYVFTYALKKIDEIMCVELLSSDKKVINLSLFRLQCNSNNRDIHKQLLKYIWYNCQNFWDTQFLTHNYKINFDVFQDFMVRELQKLHKILIMSTRIMQFNERNTYLRPIEPKNKTFLNDWKSKLIEIRELIKIASLLNQNQFLFFIMEHVIYFQQISSYSPIHFEPIIIIMKKIDHLLLIISSNITTRELSKSYKIFYQYFHNCYLYDSQ